MSPRFRLVHRASIALFVGLLLVVLADLVLGWALPQPLRGWLPWLLAASLALALTLGVGAYGAPTRPASGASSEEPDAPDEVPEAGEARGGTDTSEKRVAGR